LEPRAERAETFEAHRGHLLAVAYRMTGTLADAEDLVQDAFVKFTNVRDEVEEPRAFLTTMITRMSIDHHRSARVRRERYVGPWLPEPVVGEGALSAEAATELASDVSMALMIALDKLTALERAAFLLHDVFDVEYARVAATIGRSEPACRKLVERARAALRAEGTPRRRATREEGERILGAFLAAVSSGDVEALSSMLADDAILYSDGGGRVHAALRPIFGPTKISRFFIGIARTHPLPEGHRLEWCFVNGGPGLVVHTPAGVDQILSFEIDGSGKVTRIYGVRNPEKLERAGAPRPSEPRKDGGQAP
jgi:RNA polymerase sigma-70 factor, ECF subfamily